ncbi:hypothetical protein [Desertivibrio insolitus]|uniref:hypothetical protein n=1 Tax=Herbiconiux sp. SYSU D00978 TaxID=2812562 RepID=UPI001A9693AB|nr:hypothetical protein [Herbiconiux sp. SYSU D00978]
MRRWRWSDDSGTASLEFVSVGVLLLVPVVYLVLVLAQVQAGALAVEGAARQAVRVYVQSSSPAEGSVAAQRALAFALDDHGLDASAARLGIACEARGDGCLRRAATVTVTVSTTVPLPLVPPVLDVETPLGVPLEAQATQQVSRFWSGE